MDEEVDSEDENVNSVLAQESSELLAILQSQSPEIIMKLIQMMPSDARQNISHPVTSVLALAGHIKVMLEYFRQASAADCRCFLQTMCMLCENIPMRLETRLISVAGDANATDAVNTSGTKPVTLRNTDDCEDSSPSVGGETLPSPHSEPQLVKRPRIDHWEQYIAAVMTSLQRRWGRLSEGLVTQVQLDNVWISLRTASRGRDRPDQTPGQADRGSRTPEPDADYGSMESRVTLDVFLQGCEGKVTVLFGQSGSGKTLLMSCLGQQWARRLGPIPSSFLFVLLEFRQLNLVSRPLSLSDLLFQLYLPPNGGDHEKRDILDYLISNPEQSVWVLDGYDEFHSKLTKQEAQRERLDPEAPLPVADLISGLLNRQLLPGCTVVVTCRVRDVVDLEGVSDKVGQLLGWDSREMKDYVHNFFGTKANKALGSKAADLLLSTRHLLAMSSLPALCNICCICLEYLLLEVGDAGRPQNPEERGGGMRRRAGERGVQIPGGGRGEEGRRGENCAQREELGGRRRGSEDIMMDVTNVRAQPPPSTEAQIPPTVTQVYLTAVGAFLSRDHDKRGSDKSKTTTHPQSTVNVLSQYRSELCELSQLAWKGLENGKILFLEEDVSQDVLKFSIRTGLFSQVELRREDGTLVNSYCFVHLTVQEFLAALRIMTSQDVSDMQLKQRFSLKTRWTTKSDQRTVFTDSLYLYVCGLASPCCTPALVQLAGSAGGTNWVQKRQALVLKLLKNLCHRNTLTGSKILELCHCIQESQDHQLAREVVGTRSTLELRNIRLLPNDIDALAFVVNSVGDNGIGLDFGACSMEPECLDDLPRCRHIRHLCFHSRKYGDNFAEKLASILPKFNALKKFEFCGASLTAAGAASLASALQNCPGLTEINLSDNNLRDAGIEHVAEVFTKLPRLDSVMLGRNNSSLKAVDYLIGKVSSCPNIQSIHADGIKELMVTFAPIPESKSHKTEPEPTISLLDQKWSKSEMQTVAASLASCPVLSVLELSGGQWNEGTLRTLTQFLPKFTITKKIIVNDSCSSVEALVILTALLSECPAVMELHIRLQSPVQVSILFSGGQEKPDEMSKVLCLSSCGLQPAHLDRLWRSLGRSSDLTLLDLSSNCLGNKGLKKLLEVLPHFSNIQEIDASNNKMSMEGVVMLAGALCSHDNLTQIHISHGGRNRVTLKFSPDTSDDRRQLKVFRINHSSLLPSNMSPLCRRLAQCASRLEVDLSHSSLTDEALESLLKALPKMASLQRLDVSHCITTTAAALTLLRCLTVSQRIASVELRLQTESFIQFDSVKAEHASCRLTHFSVSGDGVDRLLQILQQGPQLSDLDLSSNHMEDEGVKHFLDFLPMLKISGYVNLSNNSLSQRGLLDVANTLCTVTNVSAVEVCLGAEQRCLIWFSQTEGGGKTLSIRHSRLEREHLLTLAEVVSVCPRLTQLEFRNNSLQAGWIEDFVKLLSGSQRGVSVSIEESWIRSEEAVGLVCRCLSLSSNIHTIRVHCTTLHISIMNSAQLTSVSLVDCALEEDHLNSIVSIIQKCPLLTELDLSHNSLGVEGAEFLCSALPSLPNLTSLSLGSKQPCLHVVKKQLCEALLQASAVHSLNLSGHVIDDTAAQVMTGLLPRLRSLNLSHCVWSPAARLQLIKALGECVHLEDLCLDSLQLNEEIKVCLTQSLREIKSIRRLRLNKIVTAELTSGVKGVVDFLAAMEGLRRMREIELEGWWMAERGVEQLTKLLPVWTELRKISLSKNLISDQSGDKLLEALSSCRCLEELHVSGNSLADLAAARMALVLPSLTHMTVLDLSENRIGCEGSASLSEAIMGMKNLTRIHLTSVGTSELCAVAARLAHCPLIQDVGLGWNSCDDKVAVELARVLPRCQKLTRIDLESNSVSVCGVEALLRALPSCPALQIIRLWRNKVSPAEASRLSAMDRRLNFSST